MAPGRQPSSVERAARLLLGDRWTILVLREAFYGVRRYGVFQRNLGIGRNVLASRLRELVDHGILERVRYRTEPDWYEYRLTPAGRELFPVMAVIKEWADKHALGPDEPRFDLYHRACATRLRPAVVCAHCGDPIVAREVVSQPPRPPDGPVGADGGAAESLGA